MPTCRRFARSSLRTSRMSRLTSRQEVWSIRSSIRASLLRSIFKLAETTSQQAYAIAQATAAKVKKLDSVNDVLIPQDLDYPGLELNINRERAGLLGISPKNVVDNVITALTSDGMVAPSFWVDPKDRQQLHADGAVSGIANSDADRLQADSACVPQAMRTQLHLSRSPTSRRSTPRQRWITTSYAACLTSMLCRRKKI